jgi:flagellar hook-associated protein 2
MSSLETLSISLTDYLNQSLAYARQPLNRLESQKSDLEIKYAVFTDLQAKLDALEDAAEALSASGTSSILRSKTVTSSAESVATAVATGAAAAGRHTVFVTQLARSHTVVSGRYDMTGTTLSSGHAGTATFTISIDGEDYDVSVAISSGETDQTVLANIATAINDVADGAIVASAVHDTPSTAKLSIMSGSTGTVGAMTFTDTDGLLASLGVTNASEATDTVGGYVYADLGGNELDAKLTIDGINVIASSNTVENVVEGLTVTLLSEQDAGDASVILAVDIDVGSIKEEILDFISAYNDAYSYIQTKTKVDSVTYQRGILSGDYPYIRLRATMRQAMIGIVSEVSSDYRSLSQIGITSDRDGHFSISDSDLLEQVIETDLSAIDGIFSSTGGIATAIDSLISGYTQINGTISASKDGVNARLGSIEDSIERQESYLSRRQKVLTDQYNSLLEALYALQMEDSIASSYTKLLGL